MAVSQNATDIARWLETDATDLPALPRVAAELATLTDDPDTACEQLAEIVVREPVLAGRMLRLVNSAYFGLSQEVTDIRHAVFLLGARRVRTVALTAAVISAFRGSKAAGFDLDRFWRHSISVAAVCATLARRCGTFEAETAFSLGLLHDLGKLLLVRYRPEDAERVIENAGRSHLSFYECERRAVPVTHPETGAWLAERWGLPAVLIGGLATHHDPPDGDLQPIDAALRFADYLCVIKGITTSGSCGEADLPPEAWHALGLNSSDLPALIDVINTEIKTADALLRRA